jgi:DNA-binding transcriptional LysR family regulator
MSFVNMELRGLKHVLVLARELNFTRAARALNITQSALTRSIQAIERSSQTRLFDRDRGSVHLTPVGKVFVERAAVILGEADDLERLLTRISQGEESKVCYGMAPSPARALLGPVLLASITDNSGLRSNVYIRNAATLLPLLIDETIEFFVCAEGQIPDSAPVKETLLGRFPLSLVVRAGHPVLKRSSARKSSSYPVLTGAALGSSTNLPNYMRPYVSTEPTIVVDDYALLAHITERSDAVLVSSSLALASEISEGRLVEIPPPKGERQMSMEMMMYSLARRTLSPAAANLAAKFVDLIKRGAS